MYNFTPYTQIDLSVTKNNTFPTDGDVLCGRGSTCYKHVGNQNFRFIIAVHLPKYTDPLTTRKEKGIMIQNIVNDLQSEGRRFLKEGITGWEVLCHKEAKYKVGHALRDAASEMKKHLKKHIDAKKAKRRNKGIFSSSNSSTSSTTTIKTDLIEKSESNNSSSNITIKKDQKDMNQSQVSSSSSSISAKKLDECGNEKTDNLISSLSHLLPEKDNHACNNKKNDDDLFETLYDNISPTLFDDTDVSSLLSDEDTNMLFDDLLLP